MIDWTHELLADYPERVRVRFEKFHAANPGVYISFARFARLMKEKGRTRYSQRTIIEVIRWHRDLQTTGDVFKVNDNYIPIYARVLMINHPEYNGFFELRMVRSKGIKSDEQVSREIDAVTREQELFS